MEKIIQKIQEQIGAGIYPGASLALYQKGSWQEYYLGLADPAKQEPVIAGLTYDLASVSKVVGVGTVLAFLVQQGKIDIDRPLASYYPDMEQTEVTIRQLLTHTSGLDPFIPGRDDLDAEGLKEALHRLKLKDNRQFHYTDVNFLLLGFLLEKWFGQDLAQIFQEQVFTPWQMKETTFGPVSQAVPTLRGVPAGVVHDPKARVLGVHAGSAGLFSTIKDMEIFLEHYLQDPFSEILSQNYALEEGKTRSLAWNLEGDWLDHTGYTGTFLLYNRKLQLAAIFLSNRTYEKDDRAQWIIDRNQLMELIKTEMEGTGKNPS